MASTIKLKNGSGAPTAGDLVQGEPALDLTNKRLYTEDSGGTVLEIGTNPTSVTTGTFTSTGIDDNATSTAITIDSSENVGIGTSSPSSKVHLSGDGDSTSKLTVQRTGATVGTAVLGYDYVGSFSNNDFKLFANSTERMRIDSSGNVGIGTSSPSNGGVLGGKSLHVSATGETAGVRVQNTTATIAGYLVTASGNNSHVLFGTGAKPLVMYTDSAERMRIDSSGNLLVGTTTSPVSSNPKAVRYGVGVQAGSLSSSVAMNANTATGVLNMASVTSGNSGCGMYMVSIVRDGLSYGTHFVGIFGVSGSSVTLYETLVSNGITVTVSGTIILCSASNGDTYMSNAVPLTIDN